MNALSRVLTPCFLLLLLALSGCANIVGKPVLPHPDEARYDDAAIKTEIASALLKTDAGKANTISVHCFNGHVFLVGEADKEFRVHALDVARSAQGVVHVTSHWFPPGTAIPARDAGIEQAVEEQVLKPSGVDNMRVSVDSWGGHVILTGTLPRQTLVSKVVSEVKRVENVKSVTSYLSVDDGRGKRYVAPPKAEPAEEAEAPVEQAPAE